jgi:RNA polymerase sigma-70 factor, ECF subfamily
MVDDDLIHALVKGDTAAFRLVVERYQRPILQCCFRFVRNKETAEDLTQEVFLEVHRSIRTFRGDSQFSTWLFRIAITKSLDHVKHMKRQKRGNLLSRLLTHEEIDEEVTASDQPRPDEVAENEERKRVLGRAIGLLPDSQRVAFTLSRNDGMSYKEIADILGTTVAAVESLLVRANANLRKTLYGYYRKQI